MGDYQISDLKSYVGTVVEGVIALHATFRGLISADVQRVVGQLTGQGCLGVRKGRVEERVTVAGQHDFLGLEVECQHADVLLGYAGTVDDGVFDVLLFPHDGHHFGDDGFPCMVANEKVGLVGAALDDIGTLGRQLCFVWLGILEKFAIDQTLAVANQPYLTAQTAEDDGRGGKAVDRVGQQTTATEPPAGEDGAAAGSTGKSARYLDAETVAGGVGRHLFDALRHQLHGIAAVGAEAAEPLGTLRRGAVDDRDEVICHDDAVLAFPVWIFRDDGLFDDVHGEYPYTRKNTDAEPLFHGVTWH